MSVIGLHGIPGCGKSATAASIALKEYKKSNSLFKQFIRYLKKQPVLVNNIYTNFPILLNKRKKIYSNIVSIYDLDNRYSFEKDSTIVIDEIQAYFDSYRDFKSFPPAISTFFQFHRHFGIKNIYVISQHPRRIISYIRDVISEYHRIKFFIRIPILHIGLVCYKICYEFEDYTDAFTKNKDIKKALEIKTKFYKFNYKKVFKSYDSKYLKVFNIDKPLIDYGTYDSLVMPDYVRDTLYSKLFTSSSVSRFTGR